MIERRQHASQGAYRVCFHTVRSSAYDVTVSNTADGRITSVRLALLEGTADSSFWLKPPLFWRFYRCISRLSTILLNTYCDQIDRTKLVHAGPTACEFFLPKKISICMNQKGIVTERPQKGISWEKKPKNSETWSCNKTHKVRRAGLARRTAGNILWMICLFADGVMFGLQSPASIPHTVRPIN